MTPRRTILTGIILGVTIGGVTGLLGALLDWPVAVRGAVMGGALALGFLLLSRKARTPRDGA